ncbi:MAG: SLC13 family permease [Bacteroidales bacterium]|nr:SLC13 family permease [Bacteroidales bacterium]
MHAYDVILVYGVIIFIIVSLYFDLMGAGFTFLLGVTVLGVFGILTPKEMLIGASNEQIAVILLLLLLGNIYRKTALLDSLFDRIFVKISSHKAFTSRVMLLIAPMSAFLNNTPLVALMMPYAYDWSKKHNQPISKILLPLSYAAILGGCATLIGTSTNLIVNGMVIESGRESLGLFDYTLIGGTMVVIGYLYMRFIGHRLLPSNYITSQNITKNTRKYVVEAQISINSPLVGKTIEEAKLRNLDGLFLFQIIRNDQEITAVPNDTILLQNDILLFAGETSSIADLFEQKKGLTMPSVGMFSRKKELDIVEIVVADGSLLVNKTLKSYNFRSKFDATVIAVHRNGEQIQGKLGAAKLKPGDTLLLLTGVRFGELASNSKDFYLISKVKEIRKLTPLQSWTLVIGTVSAIFLSSINVLSLFLALIILISILLILNVTNPKELAKSIDYDLAFIIAMALALGVAMQKTGVAEILGNVMIEIFRPWGNVGLLSGLYIITAILAAFVTNKAAVALIFPIAISIAGDLGYNAIPFILTVSFAAAANFMTPIGYQTNTMVYGPGGYKFRDFIRVGTPLTIIYGIVTIFFLLKIYF